MPALHLSFEKPPISGVVLTQLGTPAAWSSDTSPVEMLAPILRDAAGEARRLALAEPVMVDEAARDNRLTLQNFMLHGPRSTARPSASFRRTFQRVRRGLELQIGAPPRLVRTSGAWYKDICEEDHREP